MENQEQNENRNSPLPGEALVSNLVSLVETYLKVLKLEITSSTSAILSAAVLVGSMVFFGAFALLFFSICLAYALPYAFDIHLLWGFLIVGFLYVALLAISFRLRKLIQRFFERIIQQLLEK